jgi:hypothetical protein
MHKTSTLTLPILYAAHILCGITGGIMEFDEVDIATLRLELRKTIMQVALEYGVDDWIVIAAVTASTKRESAYEN